jgi:ABC-type phosphate transport system substrate-binding protein
MSLKHSLKLTSAVLALGATLAAVPAHADLFVISNTATAIAGGDVKDVFTGEKQFAGSTKLIPVDNAPAQDSFLSHALKMDAARYNTIWTKKSFREALNPPSVKAGDAEVMDFVRKTPGAVGYVSSQPSGVNVVIKY